MRNLPVGTVRIRVRQTRNLEARAFVKIWKHPSKWILRANYNWVQRNGAIPKGRFLHHIDENSLNDSPDNLLPVTIREHSQIHREKIVSGKVIASMFRCRPVECIETGMRFKSQQEAARGINVGTGEICRAIQKKYACRGRHFRRVEM